ncbi:MAG: hypothetical protein PHV68_02730 [Candidatus Gastranaerophilales bacterium]|nr:hypothetical protein [Candidatus Gastranaerophilales bacterium]
MIDKISIKPFFIPKQKKLKKINSQKIDNLTFSGDTFHSKNRKKNHMNVEEALSFIENSNIDKFKELLENTDDKVLEKFFIIKNENNENIIMQMAETDQYEMIELTISKFKNKPEILTDLFAPQAKDGYNPLMIAIEECNTKTAELIFDTFSNNKPVLAKMLTDATNEGKSALFLAKETTNVPLIKRIRNELNEDKIIIFSDVKSKNSFF